MSVNVRRRLLFALVVLTLTIPAESVLLRALSATTQTDAATQFASSLSYSNLTAAASQIEAYPFTYRRAIMAALPPAVRAVVWQGHIAAYITMHPELDPSSAALLKTTIGLITPDVMSGSGASNAQISAIAVQIQATLGKDVADYLLYRLGLPDTSTSSNILPIRERLANFVRKEFTLIARANDCDCSTDWGCDASNHCDNSTGCNPDNTWPMCGWLWNETCDGSCLGGISR
jgi:hypothetical protein